MRKRLYVSFSVAKEEGPRCLGLIQRLGCSKGWQAATGYRVRPGYSYTFDANDPRIERLLDYLRATGETWIQRHEAVYTLQELRAAPLLAFYVDAAERDVERPYNDEFDFASGCQACGTGAPQIGPLKLRASRLPKKASVCTTVHAHCLVAESLYNVLAAARLTGLELRRAVSTRDEPLPWWQIVPLQVMPPMASEQRCYVRAFGRRQCDVCGRDGWAAASEDEVPQIVYRRSQLDRNSLPDVTQTWECFGLSAFDCNGYLAQGALLLRPNVLDILQQAQVRGQYTPVMIIED